MLCAHTAKFTVVSDTTFLSLHSPSKENLKHIVIHMQESMHKAPESASQVVLGRMQLTLHSTRRTPYGTSRLVHTMPAWLAKIRRAPSRYCNARGYGHTTTPKNGMSTPATPLSPSPGPPRRCTPLWRRWYRASCPSTFFGRGIGGRHTGLRLGAYP